MGVRERLRGLLGFFRRTERSVVPHVQTRGRVDHVVLLDGTMSSLDEGSETKLSVLGRSRYGWTDFDLNRTRLEYLLGELDRALR